MACCDEVKPTCGSDSGEVTDNVKEYYGETLKERNELKTGICLLNWSAPPSIRAAISLVHEEITKRYYGCGLPFPEAVDGCNVLDLGSGTGRDAFVFSKLVGPDGRVVGVDMIQGQLDIANQYVPYHMEKFGFDSPNVEFKKGYLEDLREAGVSDDFFDIVVSNCVINLCKDKKKVLGEAFRAMKAGGEIFFSDVYASKQKPEEAKADKEAWGEGLAGALYWKDLHQLCKELGFSTPVFVTAKAFPVRDERLMKLFDGIEFVSATYRIFKPNPTVDRIPASVVYKGTIVDNADSFKFAKGIEFLTGQSAEVDSELACILKSSRYAKHFDFGPVPSDTTDLLKVGEENPFCCS